MNLELDRAFLKRAYAYAKRFSTDPSTQNGALLVRENQQFAIGANHFPLGVTEKSERWERPAKYQFVEHAERNVIFACAKIGVATGHSTMFCPWFACADCARAIIQAGISEVVGHDCPLHKRRPDWYESIRVAMEMLKEAGVKTRYYTGELGEEIIFNGVLERV